MRAGLSRWPASARAVAASLLVTLVSPAAAATLTRGPYLQLLTATSVTVVWNTDLPAVCSVAVAPVGGTASVIDGGSGTVCAVAVGGLVAGTEYAYTPQADGVALDQPSTFHTDDPAAPFSFLVFGDSGCACTAQFAVRDRLLATPADFIVHTGDMIYDAGAAADFDPKFFAPYRDLLRRMVLWPCRGNHDVETANGAPWRDAFWTPANNPAGSEDYYSFDYGNAHFVVLDSNADTAPGGAQHEFLQQDLAASQARWKLVAFHHPIYSSSRHGSALTLRADLRPLFDGYRVDVVFMGHDHDYERTKPLRGDRIVAPGFGTVYVTTGGGGKSLYQSGASDFTAYAESVNHFTHVAIDGDTLDLQMIRADGSVGDTMRLEKASGPACGNGTVDPGEACDLGARNGVADSGCGLDCRLVGRCTGGGDPCVPATDCPPEEGCCGNGTLDAGEECDDGNQVDGDCCSPRCRTVSDCEPLTCAASGPHLVAATVKRTLAIDPDGDGTSQRWRTQGSLPAGAEPADPVTLTLSAGGKLLYEAHLARGSFAGRRTRCPRAWHFLDRAAAAPGAPGWRSARFTQARGRRGCSNTVEFDFRSGNNAPLDTPPARMRQTIEVGDLCATAVLACRPKGGGRVTCKSTGR
jgi:cysteine-rich repeat protein